jgi:hypothetical protein
MSLLRGGSRDMEKDSGVPRFRGHCGPPRLPNGPCECKVHLTVVHKLSNNCTVPMSTSRLALRSARAVARLESCSVCQSRQITSTIRHKASRYPQSPYGLATGTRSQSYATKQRFDAPRVRADVDTRARLGFYSVCKHSGAFEIEPRTAMSIYNDFVAHSKTMSHGHNVSRIVESVF